jgi:hypothetical protein
VTAKQEGAAIRPALKVPNGGQNVKYGDKTRTLAVSAQEHVNLPTGNAELGGGSVSVRKP